MTDDVKRNKRVAARPKERTSEPLFIFGEAGNRDENGLPDFILVRPQKGSSVVAVYKKYMTGKTGQ